jgi:hypothetical protein
MNELKLSSTVHHVWQIFIFVLPRKKTFFFTRLHSYLSQEGHQISKRLYTFLSCLDKIKYLWYRGPRGLLSEDPLGETPERLRKGPELRLTKFTDSNVSYHSCKESTVSDTRLLCTSTWKQELYPTKTHFGI